MDKISSSVCYREALRMCKNVFCSASHICFSGGGTVRTYSMFTESSKTFNNSWIQLHMILKFGSFVALLDPLKIVLNYFVQMFDIIFTANQNFHNTFPMGSHISTASITALS